VLQNLCEIPNHVFINFSSRACLPSSLMCKNNFKFCCRSLPGFMVRRVWFSVCASVLAGVALRAAPHHPLLMISIDGLRPDYISNADQHGLKIPVLRALFAQGAHAAGVRGVLPTSTYPSHTTLVTGVAPARHGILGNHPFGAEAEGLDIWYYYSEDLHATTLWDAATAAGRVVASVSWPVTVGAPSIRYNIPEIMLTRTDEDLKLTRGAATPGLMAELAARAGPYLSDAQKPVARDWARARYGLEVIRLKKPGFFTVHFAATDHFQHRSGPFTPAVLAALEEIDTMIGQLVAAMREQDPATTFCIVSDHGFSRVDHFCYLDAAFVEGKLVTLKGPGKTIEKAGIAKWVARTWPAGGSAAIVLHDPADAAARTKVKALLERLAADPANGIAHVLDEAEVKAMGGAPTAQFWVDLKPGYQTSGALDAKMVAPTIASAVSPRGTHGYSPEHAEMNATFILTGPGIRAVELPQIDMRGIAPTLAKVMGVDFPSAERPALDVFTPVSH